MLEVAQMNSLTCLHAFIQAATDSKLAELSIKQLQLPGKTFYLKLLNST